MVRKLKKAEAEIYQSQIREQTITNQQQKMELKLLAGQIHPHFLYNTLESIRMKAFAKGNREVANAIKLLSKSMRYVLGTTQATSTTLENELDYIATYLANQKLRFGSRISYDIKVNESLQPARIQILPILLQPIVENAFSHGLENRAENGRIILKLYPAKDRTCLTAAVFDNGEGMSREKLSDVVAHMNTPPKDSGHGVGLYNTNNRIRLFYGEEYGITIRSKRNYGTCVFSVCGTASNGKDALDKILDKRPDLVLLDIRMPILNGIEVVQAAVEAGFTGKFIILSGLTDFKLAQTAMRFGVDFYLTKPIDKDELEQAVRTVRELIEKESRRSSSYTRYRDKAKENILREILLDTCLYDSLDLKELHLQAGVYQVITYGQYNQDSLCPVWDFAELMRVTNQDNNSFDILEMEQRNIILLKGDFAIERFRNLLSHYHAGPQKGSPFDTIFLTYGRPVSVPEDIHLSYRDVCRLEERRFFCEENQHVLGFPELHRYLENAHEPDPSLASQYTETFSRYIQAHNPTLITETLKELSDYLTGCAAEIMDIKHFLIDLYIMVKQRIMQAFPQTNLPFPANASVIVLVEKKYYLYEIIAFLAEQFEMWMHSVGFSSGENVLDEILYYIQHNYRDNLKLESIAPLFGYNSSYLGRLFTRKLNVNFNAYLDQVRIAEAKKLLDDHSLKVYEIAEQVGYKSVDYFHRKFKKYEGTSPAEYRKSRGEFHATDQSSP